MDPNAASAPLGRQFHLIAESHAGDDPALDAISHYASLLPPPDLTRALGLRQRRPRQSKLLITRAVCWGA